MSPRPTGVGSRKDVDVPAWAADLRTGDVVTVETAVAGVVEAEVIGFSMLDDYYGQPAIETPNCVCELLAEVGRADQAPDVLALKEDDLIEEELVTDGGQTPSARLQAIAEDLDDVEKDLRRKGRYERSLASVLEQMSDVLRRIAQRLEGRRSDTDRFRIDDDELLTDGGAVTTGDQHLCHGCGVLHDGRGAALACCSDRFAEEVS